MNERDTIVRCLYDNLGKQYEWAGISPATGFDCSGLAYYCYGWAGVPLSRGSVQQWDNARFAGQEIPVAKAQPGDLIFWGHHQADHVGIVSKPGWVINALNEGLGVRETRIGGAYGIPLLGAASILSKGVSQPPTHQPPEPTIPSNPEPDRPKRQRRKNRRKEDQR